MGKAFTWLGKKISLAGCYLNTKCSVYSTIAYFYLKRHISQHRWFRKRYVCQPATAATFEKITGNIPSEKVFVHVAMSAIKTFTEKNSYQYLKKLLEDNFSVIACQAFTPGVRKKKIFDPVHEKPAYGTFAQLFVKDAVFRNHDPCYSVAASGNVCWSPETFSFTGNGIFRKMVEEDFYCMNVGMEHVTCSLMHFVEYEQRVPYLHFYNERYIVRLGQKEVSVKYPIHSNKRGYSVKGYIWWNKHRLMNDLMKTTLVNVYNIGGVTVYCFSMQQLYHFVTGKVKNDPCYLIKW